MTLKELYSLIEGNYDQAVRIMRMDKMISRYLLKLKDNPARDRLMAAGEAMDPTQLFEAAHALKGVCANLGLDALSQAASDIAEEFRPGSPRKHSDAEVKAMLEKADALYQKFLSGIQQYEANPQ
ncbi:MAG: Hpt domain-containing protein [Clostridia bacterium]|nr:Hpt domain-containing protein [Clostridia bacterium]